MKCVTDRIVLARFSSVYLLYISNKQVNAHLKKINSKFNDTKYNIITNIIHIMLHAKVTVIQFFICRTDNTQRTVAKVAVYNFLFQIMIIPLKININYFPRVFRYILIFPVNLLLMDVELLKLYPHLVFLPGERYQTQRERAEKIQEMNPQIQITFMSSLFG